MKNILFTLALLISFASFGQLDNGEKIRYYGNGAVFSKENYVDGKEQGESTEYYENGEIKEIKNYKDGELIEN